jgi:hypothetical protein
VFACLFLLEQSYQLWSTAAGLALLFLTAGVVVGLTCAFIAVAIPSFRTAGLGIMDVAALTAIALFLYMPRAEEMLWFVWLGDNYRTDPKLMSWVAGIRRYTGLAYGGLALFMAGLLAAQRLWQIRAQRAEQDM